MAIVSWFIKLLVFLSANVVGHGILLYLRSQGYHPEEWVAGVIGSSTTPEAVEAIRWILAGILGLCVVGCYEFFVRRRRKASDVVSERKPNGQNPRKLDTKTRQKLVDDLKLVVGEHTNVKIVFWPPQYRPFIQSLDGVFNTAGWATNTNLTPQEPHGSPYRSGVEVRGFNKHLVDAVCVALRNAGISDVRDNVVPLKIRRDNPKFPTSQHRIYLDIGHVEDGPR